MDPPQSSNPQNTENNPTVYLKTEEEYSSSSSTNDTGSDFSDDSSQDSEETAKTEAEVTKKENKREEHIEKLPLYLPLYRAVLDGNWEIAKSIFERDSDAITAKITWNQRTPLHVAVSTGDSIDFLKKLVNLMSVESLEQRASIDETALSVAAVVGNIEAAKILVKKNKKLTQMRDMNNLTPLHLAAEFGHKQMVEYLMLVTRNNCPSQFAGKEGAEFLTFLIINDFYGIALDVLNRYTELPVWGKFKGETALHCLARKPQAFESGSQLGFWQRFIYHFIPVEIEAEDLLLYKNGDIENPSESSKVCGVRFQYLQHIIGGVYNPLRLIIWKILTKTVPGLSNIYDAKLAHMQAMKLVRLICNRVLKEDYEKASKLFRPVIIRAAINGIPELVTNIIKTFPHSIWFLDVDSRNIFQLAVLHRREKIFNLIYQLSSAKHITLVYQDKNLDNILHFAGKFVQQPSQTSIPALQLQRQLQWFKEVEKLVKPSFRTCTNREMKTARMVFDEEHAPLLVKSEKWMKATASPCAVISAFIAIVAFAATFTMHRTNGKDEGNTISILVFSISDVVALFSSSTSVMMFLSIITSRYSAEDFLKSLPKRLIIGLISLFVSIAAMIAAFIASVHMVFVDKVKWDLIPIAVLLGFILVFLFGLMQFPLLVEITFSTYGRSVFRQQRKDKIY